MIRISEIVSVVVKYSTIAVIVTSVLIGSVFYSSVYVGGGTNIPDTQMAGNTTSTERALSTTITSSQTTLALNTSKSVVSTSTTSSYSLSTNSSSSSSTFSFTSTSSCSNLNQTIEKNGTTYEMTPFGNSPYSGQYITLFNFSKSTVSTNFTLTGSFLSDKNFSLGIGYGNGTWSGNQTTVWSRFDNATGNYSLDLNLTLPLYSQFAVWYSVEVQVYYVGSQPWLVNSTSNLQIMTSQCASLSYLEYQH